ncbi:MAG: hypothetical protein IIZ14_04555 [Solobacterium sp.]|nr:hypothetical protein [Solobacterium sp.]
MSRILKRMIAALAVLCALYFMPFVTSGTTDDTGKKWNVPFGASFVQRTDSSAVFRSFRSAYALGKDAENAVHSYEETGCYGRTYYYDEVQDVSIYAHTEENGLPSTLTYHFENGNICAGWTLDDEIAWPFGDPLASIKGLTKEKALEEGWLVIEDGVCPNVPVYNDFSRMVKQGVFCYLRTVIYEQGVCRMIDIQLLENGHFRVIRCDGTAAEEKDYIRLSDSEQADGSKPVYVYEENSALAEPDLLFTVK